MSEFADLLDYEDHQGDVMSDIAQMNYEEGLIQEWVFLHKGTKRDIGFHEYPFVV